MTRSGTKRSHQNAPSTKLGKFQSRRVPRYDCNFTKFFFSFLKKKRKERRKRGQSTFNDPFRSLGSCSVQAQPVPCLQGTMPTLRAFFATHFWCPGQCVARADSASACRANAWCPRRKRQNGTALDLTLGRRGAKGVWWESLAVRGWWVAF